ARRRRWPSGRGASPEMSISNCCGQTFGEGERSCRIEMFLRNSGHIGNPGLRIIKMLRTMVQIPRILLAVIALGLFGCSTTPPPQSALPAQRFADDVELPIDRALFREFERAIRACAGVVDDHVDGAERRACLLDRRCDLRAIGDVELEEANVVVGRELALLLGRSHRRGDVPSLLSEVLRSELAESSARTGDQDRLWHALLLYGPCGPEMYTRTSHDYSPGSSTRSQWVSCGPSWWRPWSALWGTRPSQSSASGSASRSAAPP